MTIVVFIMLKASENTVFNHIKIAQQISAKLDNPPKIWVNDSKIIVFNFMIGLVEREQKFIKKKRFVFHLSANE